MIVGIGLGLLALTLYMSTLAYALRDYSRAKLAENLSEKQQQRWMAWLDEHGTELPVLAGFVRVGANLGVLLTVTMWYFGAPPEGAVQDWLLPALIALGLLAIFAIGIPHALAMHAGEAFLAGNLQVLRGLRLLLSPLAWLVRGIEFVVRRLLGKIDSTEDENSEWVEQEILEAISEGEATGAVDEEQREMIESVFELHETTASAIMTPRTKIVALEADTPPEEIVAIIRAAGHSRIPVYEKSLDNILGVLYVKDLIGLPLDASLNLRERLREVPYVPETKTVDELLREFKSQKVHIAIVLDEYGGTAGLITIEDILEEVVGEITDEYDQEEAPTIQRIDDHTIEVDGSVHVADINAELDIEIPENGAYETIGGFVFTKLGKIPAAGEELADSNLQIRVLEAGPRKINRLRVSVLEPAEAER